MKYLKRFVGTLAILALMPLAPLGAQQQKGVGAWRPVKDDIGFFSPQAKEQADQKVAELKRTFNKDLFIEATKAPPHPKELNIKDKPAVDKFFDRYAEKRFTDLHQNGVYVMIVDNPHVLRVQVGNNTMAEGYFTGANRSTLIEKIRERLNHNDKDGALLTAANYVFDTMKTNHPVVNRKSAVAPAAVNHEGGQGAASGFRWSPILTILLVVAGVWVLFAIVRALFRGASGGMGGAPGMGYGGGGGGGFLSSLMGGMFGAAAGMWMYNNFFGGHSGSSAWGAGPSDGGGSYPDSGPADTSSSGGGADYGDDAGAGGGDWGGGGGDAGGGDWGGGGGDFGGGGGDW